MQSIFLSLTPSVGRGLYLPLSRGSIGSNNTYRFIVPAIAAMQTHTLLIEERVLIVGMRQGGMGSSYIAENLDMP